MCYPASFAPAVPGKAPCLVSSPRIDIINFMPSASVQRLCKFTKRTQGGLELFTANAAACGAGRICLQQSIHVNIRASWVQFIRVRILSSRESGTYFKPIRAGDLLGHGVPSPSMPKDMGTEGDALLVKNLQKGRARDKDRMRRQVLNHTFN